MQRFQTLHQDGESIMKYLSEMIDENMTTEQGLKPRAPVAPPQQAKVARSFEEDLLHREIDKLKHITQAQSIEIAGLAQAVLSLQTILCELVAEGEDDVPVAEVDLYDNYTDFDPETCYH